MDSEEAASTPIDIFDNTFIWPHRQYPLRPLGRLTLKQNPNNYFQEIEQAAFSPSNMVPGIGPSADLVLQARIFSYPDAQRYRVGPNYQQLPPNKPRSKVYSPYQRDGPGRIDGTYGGNPDYVQSSLQPLRVSTRHAVPTHEQWNGQVVQHATEVTDKDFEQPRALWEIICNEKDGQKQFVDNIVPTLWGIKHNSQVRALDMFARVDPDIKRLLQAEVQRRASEKSGASPNQNRK